MITLLAQPADVAAGEVEVTGDAYRHLFRARRLAVGDRLRVVDGRGRARWGEVRRVTGRAATLELGEDAPSGEPRRQVRLIVAPPRYQRATWLVEKATELGVAAVHFVTTERSGHTYGAGNLERLHRVAASALEQCHGSRLPAVTGMHAWHELDELAAGCDGRFFLDLTAAEPADGPLPETVAVAIGPEGGWSKGERSQLLGAGWHPLHLGPRTLRVETAALVAAAKVLLS